MGNSLKGLSYTLFLSAGDDTRNTVNEVRRRIGCLAKTKGIDGQFFGLSQFPQMPILVLNCTPSFMDAVKEAQIPGLESFIDDDGLSHNLLPPTPRGNRAQHNPGRHP